MKRLIAIVVALAAPLAACGDDGPTSTPVAADGTRIIEITMVDHAFEPAALSVATGETVTFVLRNDGAGRHEAVIGDLAAQEAHRTEMAEMDGEHGDVGTHSDDAHAGGGHSTDHDGESMTAMHGVVVEPGQTVEMTHAFDAVGDIMIGCHEPGHWEAGMKADITVT